MVAVVWVAQPEVVFVVVVVLVAEPEAASVVAVVGVAEPEVAFVVAVVEAAGPEADFVAAFSIPSELQVSVNIHTVFAVSIPVAVVVEGLDICQRPIFFLFPNIDCYTSFSSSVQDVDKESVGSPTAARANDGPCSILSNRSLYHNKNRGCTCNKPNPGHNNVSDTSALPIDTTTNPHRKRCLLLYQEQHRHTSRVSLSLRVARQMR